MRVDEIKTNHKFYSLSKFKGVDYASSPMQVKPYRAVDMDNFILRDGALSKRNGFRQIKKLNSSALGNMRGFWKTPNGMYIYIIGTDESAFIYLAENIPKSGEDYAKDVDTADDLLHKVVGLNTRYASAVTSKDKLYIFCGDYFVYGNLYNEDGSQGWQLKRVADDRYNTYIPNTMINIVCEDSKLNHSYPRVLNEKINLLMRMRKNVLIAEPKHDGKEFTRYFLDGVTDVKSTLKPKITVYVNDTLATTITDFVAQENKWVSSQSKVEISVYAHGASLGKKEAELYIPYNTSFNVLFEDGAQIVVEYPVADPEDYAQYISTASTCAIYGADGRADRLFVAGNQIAPNMVYYSANGADYTPNFTYFPINNFVVCGQTQKEITALGRISGGSLAVFKNVGSKQEPSVYFISGSAYLIDTDEAGVPYYEDMFSVSSGSIEVEGIAPRSVTNFAGDSLFIGNGGVYAIELSSNVASPERYARERSRMINPKINAVNAQAVVFDNKYYFTNNDGYTYVADARYRFTEDADMDDTFNYEWFRLSNINAEAWYVENGKLYFTQHDSLRGWWLCEFTNEYADLYRTTKSETLVYKAENGEYRIAIVEYLKAYAEKCVQVETLHEKGYTDQIWSVNEIKYDAESENPCWYFSVPSNITLAEGNISLLLHCPIKAYWKSGILDLSDPIHRKNLHSISGVFLPKKNGRVEIGYTTRLDEQYVEAQGANVFDFNDMNFCFFSFDAGGLANAYRQKCFDRGFVCVQLLFKSDSIGDCAIDSISLEYNTTIKNIGVR